MTTFNWIIGGERCNYVSTDCGRSPKEKNDCTVRAVAKCFDLDYEIAHKKLAVLGRKNREGVNFAGKIAPNLPLELCAEFVGRKIRECLPDMKKGRYIVRVAWHVFAVVDGVVFDTGSAFSFTYTRPIRMVYKATSTVPFDEYSNSF